MLKSFCFRGSQCKLRHVRHGKSGHRPAFTLIELLVVISIIALLLSILMPALNKVKRQAKALICSTRLKSIGTALVTYSGDFNNKIPPTFPMNEEEYQGAMAHTFADNWIDRVAPYMGKVETTSGFGSSAYNSPYFRCPTQEYILKMIKRISSTGDTIQMSHRTGKLIDVNYPGLGAYGLNWYFSGFLVYQSQGRVRKYDFRRMGQIRQPSSLPMVSDVAAEPFYGYEGVKDIGSPVTLGGWLMRPKDPHPIAYNHGWTGEYDPLGPAALHDGKINYLFADGHVEPKKNSWPWDSNDDYTGAGDRLSVFHPTRSP